MDVARLSPTAQDGFKQGVCTRAEVDGRLAHWHEMLRQNGEGLVNKEFGRDRILGQIDRWLDESLDLRGR